MAVIVDARAVSALVQAVASDYKVEAFHFINSTKVEVIRPDRNYYLYWNNEYWESSTNPN